MIKSKFIQNINLENLIFISNELKEFNPFVYFGTLLGLTRENNVLKDDDDIDLCLNSKFRENVIKKLNNLNEIIKFVINILFNLLERKIILIHLLIYIFI